MILICIAIVRILHVHVTATHVIQIATDVTAPIISKSMFKKSECVLQVARSGAAILTQCLRCFAVRRYSGDWHWHEFSAVENDWRWRRAATVTEWPWRHLLLVVCQNPSSSLNFRSMHRPSKWIHNTNFQFERTCMPAAENRAPLCIPSHHHCRKCTIYKCPVRAHSDDLARWFVHGNRGIRPSDWFAAPKNLQTHNSN